MMKRTHREPRYPSALYPPPRAPRQCAVCGTLGSIERADGTMLCARCFTGPTLRRDGNGSPRRS